VALSACTAHVRAEHGWLTADPDEAQLCGLSTASHWLLRHREERESERGGLSLRLHFRRRRRRRRRPPVQQQLEGFRLDDRLLAAREGDGTVAIALSERSSAVCGAQYCSGAQWRWQPDHQADSGEVTK
jgi:hypothetical protein